MNHKTDMQAALQACVDVLLHDGVPTDPEHPKRIALIAAEAALASRPDAQADERYDLLQAAVNCPHEIESNRVVLHYSDKQPGHNALAQLRERLTRAAAPQAEATQGVPENVIDAVSKALRRAWQLGQTYWQQADSNSYKQQDKSDETQKKFEKLVDETRSMLATPSPDREQAGEFFAPTDIAFSLSKEQVEREMDASPSRECEICRQVTTASCGFFDCPNGECGERKGEALSDDARECLQDVVSHYGNFVEALTCKRDAVTTKTDREYWQHELNVNARMKRQAERALAASAPTLGDVRYTQADMERYGRAVADAREKRVRATAQPQAADPKGLTNEQRENFAARMVFVDKRRGLEIVDDIVRALLAKGE